MREVVSYPRKALIFWGDGYHTPLIFIEHTLRDSQYSENILKAIIQPLCNEFGKNFIFQDKNAQTHYKHAGERKYPLE